MNIAVAGTGYVGLSLAVLLAQHHKVTAVDIVPARVDLLNQKKSPIVDRECVPSSKIPQIRHENLPRVGNFLAHERVA